jgi:hypothetical protein
VITRVVPVVFGWAGDAGGGGGGGGDDWSPLRVFWRRLRWDPGTGPFARSSKGDTGMPA